MAIFPRKGLSVKGCLRKTVEGPVIQANKAASAGLWLPTDSGNCPWSIIRLLQFCANTPDLCHKVSEERGACLIPIHKLHTLLNQEDNQLQDRLPLLTIE